MREHIRKAVIEGGSFYTHAASGGEDERGEHTMLHIQNSLIVFPFFGRFVLLAGSSYVFGAIARSIGVEHPHVKVGVLCLVPKTTSLDVEACLCTKNCRSVGEGFTSQGLEGRHCDRLRRVVWQS